MTAYEILHSNGPLAYTGEKGPHRQICFPVIRYPEGMDYAAFAVILAPGEFSGNGPLDGIEFFQTKKQATEFLGDQEGVIMSGDGWIFATRSPDSILRENISAVKITKAHSVAVQGASARPIIYRGTRFHISKGNLFPVITVNGVLVPGGYAYGMGAIRKIVGRNDFNKFIMFPAALEAIAMESWPIAGIGM